MKGRRLGQGLRSDEGSILPLLAGFVALALALILVVAAASSLYLTRARLYLLADAAALAAAQSFDLDEVAVDPDGAVTPVLSDARAEAAVSEYLRAARGTVEGLRVESAGSPDGASAAVALSAVWRPPLLSSLLPGGMRIAVASVARTALR